MTIDGVTATPLIKTEHSEGGSCGPFRQGARGYDLYAMPEAPCPRALADFLELYGKACHYYADRQELTGPDGRPVEALSGIKVEFVNRSPAL
jgi:hypothetical protein